MSIRTTTLNTFYFSIVFLIALAISTLSLARRINTLESTRSPILLDVDKEDIVITNPSAGKIVSVAVQEGQHVKAGELLVELADESVLSRIKTLEDFADENLSARTEVNLLRSQIAQNSIVSPRDAVVYKVNAGAGTYLNQNSEIIILFADTNLRLTGLVSPSQYAEMQQKRTLSTYSPRLQQVYKIELEGVGRVQPASQFETSKYEVIFRFLNRNEGAAFIEGETLEITGSLQEDEILRPSNMVAKFWNAFIIGK